MSLGRPTRGLTLKDLQPESGKGNSLTCFAALALDDWQENIPQPGRMCRRDRRELMHHLALSSHVDLLQMMGVILIKKREARGKKPQRRIA